MHLKNNSNITNVILTILLQGIFKSIKWPEPRALWLQLWTPSNCAMGSYGNPFNSQELRIIARSMCQEGRASTNDCNPCRSGLRWMKKGVHLFWAGRAWSHLAGRQASPFCSRHSSQWHPAGASHRGKLIRSLAAADLCSSSPLVDSNPLHWFQH